MALFNKWHDSLSTTRAGFGTKVLDVLTGRAVNEDLFEELEEALITADIGVGSALFLTDRLRARARQERIKEARLLQTVLQEEITQLLQQVCGEADGLTFDEGKLNMVLFMGVNGAGKTTSIGKLAAQQQARGKKVLLAAADTFRAAASEQLEVWAKRAHCDIVRQGEGADPGAVVFDACKAAASRGADLLLIDTAGRLQNKSNLMEELKKICRIASREAQGARLQTLLVLDAGTGQNAVSQARLFAEVTAIDGLILTKLDGTAKGGAVIGICRESGLPVKMIGVGEGIDDLQAFDAAQFTAALFV